MAKKILSVGVEIPGGHVENVDLESQRSLLDADIVIFSPGIPDRRSTERYNGRACLSDDSSFRSKEALAHWRRELAAAVDAGKLVIILLTAPDVVYAATGQVEFSGTGRNARKTRMVSELSSYGSIPEKWQFHSASGQEMSVVPGARFFTSYWSEFGSYSRYEAYIEGEIKEPLVKTKAGNRILGACIRKRGGALVLLPNLVTNEEDFIEEKEVKGEIGSYWSKKAQIFGRRFTQAVVGLAGGLASEVAITPPPDWARDDTYRMLEETEIEREIERVTVQEVSLEDRRRQLEARLEAAGTLRNLLYEQGKPLERAVLEALCLFGFDAKGFNKDGSEFDAVFVSSEGRFIGEVEGKDTRAINIEKFSQLERNLNEDFARDDVDQFAKGVLFANAYRLQPPEVRDSPFTDKCRTAATRLGVALVDTPSLFAPCRYLKSSGDAEYARKCREAMFATVGQVVEFPRPPALDETEKTVTEELIEGSPT